jgi:hypothetical protein
MVGLVPCRLLLFSCLLVLAGLPAEAGQTPPPGMPEPRPTGPGRPAPGSPPPRIDPATGPRDRQAEATGTGRIAGRVIGGDAAQPLRRAVVQLHGEALQEGRVTTTDEHGRYEFKDLPAGRLFVNAHKAGYVGLAYGQRRTGEGGRPLELGDGQSLDKIDFNLPRGGVIAGRISDEFGEPVAGVRVSVVHYRYIDGRRQLVPTGGSATDDLGRFRAYGLPAGDYYVMTEAGGGTVGFFMGAQSDSRSGFAPTYFPGTASLGEAQPVRVASGQEVGSINFAVVPARTAKVTGVVLDSDGRTVSGGFIMVQPDTKGSSSFTVQAGGMIRSDGNFTIANLAPGDYILHVNLDRGGDEAESAAVAVTVASEDITGLTIVTSQGALTTGQVLFETAPGDGVKPSDFGFLVNAVNPVSPMRNRFVTLQDDWTFETRLHEGPALIRGTRLPDGWMLKSVMHGGVDVIDTGLEFRSGERIEGVQLVLSRRTATVTGVVTDDRNRPARDYTVVIFPEDPGRWGLHSRYLFVARPTQEGRYEVAKVPAGHYAAAAVDHIEDGQQHDPEFLTRLRGYATPFQVSDGERRVLNLKLTSTP